MTEVISCDLPFALVANMFKYFTPANLEARGVQGRDRAEAKRAYLTLFRLNHLAREQQDVFQVYRLLLPEVRAHADVGHAVSSGSLYCHIVGACSRSPELE